MTREEIQQAFTQGIALPEGKFMPLIYLRRVDEPEFGCEGRPDGGVICGTVYGVTPETERVWQVEEQLLWRTGLDDGMWVGRWRGGYALLSAAGRVRALDETTFRKLFG